MSQIAQLQKNVFKNSIPLSGDIVFERNHQLPHSVNYTITRFYSNETFFGEDTGILSYFIDKEEPANNCLELQFSTTRNRFSTEKNKTTVSETTDIFQFHFTPTFLNQFVQNIKLVNKKDEVLAFHYPYSFTKLFPLCNHRLSVLEALLTNDYKGAIQNVFINAKVHELLLYSIECLIDEKEDVFSCRFLADEGGRERIYQARDILLQRIGEPITIKELSRKVAINECYLKKGFKEVFGTTIFDFYQQQRMEHAKYLLYEKSLSVTDVSHLLGYSSISHFSSAFKKHTGLKPCELLK